MTILDAVAGDDDDDLSAPARTAGADASAPVPPAPAPAWPPPIPVLPIEYERAAQPAESRIVWESHPDGETFTDPFSAWRTLSSIGQWGILLLASLLHFALFRFKIARDMEVGWVLPIAQCVLTGWVLFRIAWELRAWGKPTVLSVRSGVLTLSRSTLGGVRRWQWPVEKVTQIDVAVGSSAQHAIGSMRIRFHGGRRISLFRCKSRREGIWIAHKLAAAMNLPESAVH